MLMGCTDQASSTDVILDCVWLICEETGLIYLKDLLPPEILYAENHNSGVVGNLWMEHHREFASFIREFEPSGVYEVGGQHGILASEYAIETPIPWLIKEPSPAPVNSKVRFEEGFFDGESVIPKWADMIVHSHVLEHMYDYDDFFSNVYRNLNYGDMHCFSVPNMSEMLSRGYTNCLNLEHTALISEPVIEYLCKKFQFKIIKKVYFREDHSIFYATQKMASVNAEIVYPNEFETNKKLFLSYVEGLENEVEKLKELLEDVDQDIFIFGAHVFSQTLLKGGLEDLPIRGVLDNSLDKIGKRLYGTELKVLSPLSLKDFNAPHIILRAGVYNTEIKNQILNEINSTAVFV